MNSPTCACHAVPQTTNLSETELIEQNRIVRSKLKKALLLCVSFLILEIVGAYLSGSLALLSDAAHLALDLVSILIAYGTAIVSDWEKSPEYPFGYRRLESVAALVSTLLLLLLTLYLVILAGFRLWHPEPIQTLWMSSVALVGVIMNVVLASVLGEHHTHLPGSQQQTSTTISKGSDDRDTATAVGSEDMAPTDSESDSDTEDQIRGLLSDDDAPRVTTRKATQRPASLSTILATLCQFLTNTYHEFLILFVLPFLPRNLNLRATYLHVLGDLVQSLGVLLAAIVLQICPSWKFVDPLCTILFGLIVGGTCVPVLRASLDVLLLRAPRHVNVEMVRSSIQKLPSIRNITELHVFRVSDTETALTVRVVTTEDPTTQSERIRSLVNAQGITHITVQCDRPRRPQFRLRTSGFGTLGGACPTVEVV